MDKILTIPEKYSVYFKTEHGKIKRRIFYNRGDAVLFAKRKSNYVTSPVTVRNILDVAVYNIP